MKGTRDNTVCIYLEWSVDCHRALAVMCGCGSRDDLRSVKMYREAAPLEVVVAICTCTCNQSNRNDVDSIFLGNTTHGGREFWEVEGGIAGPNSIVFRPHLLVRNRFQCFEIALFDDASVELSTLTGNRAICRNSVLFRNPGTWTDEPVTCKITLWKFPIIVDLQS